MDQPREGKSVSGRTPSGEDVEFVVCSNQLRAIETSGRTVQLFDLFSASEVVWRPRRIYKGLKRPGFESAFCYVGRPSQYTGSKPSAPPEGFVFVVCIIDYVIFEWGWEKSDPTDPDAPEDASGRYDQLQPMSIN